MQYLILCKSPEQEHDVSPKDVNKVNLRFKASPRLLEELGELSYEKIKK